MKKLLFIGLVYAGNLCAQVPANDVDSLIRPDRTDSADFSNPSYHKDSASTPQQHSQPSRRDSLPLDDRKPKGPPKK